MTSLFRSAVFVLTLILADAAVAGDYAERNVFGFSPDGAYFAFEEYGVQDGSGFPYANIFLIETATDSWVDGSPVRVLIEHEAAHAGAARAEAWSRADQLLDGHEITVPGQMVASNPVTETSADPHSVSFRLQRLGPGADDSYALTLAEYDLPAANCPDIGFGPFKGFRLTLTAPDGSRRVMAEDRSIPASRRCPLGYGIAEVLTFTEAASPVVIVLIDVFSVGFEGPDRRFIAVAARL